MDEKKADATPATDNEQVKKAIEDASAAPIATTKPRLFVKKGSELAPIGIHVFFRADTGDVVSVVSTDATIDIERLTKYLGHMILEFKFTKPLYQELSRYRQRSTVQLPDGSTTVDNNKMRDFYLVYHLKGWNVLDVNDVPIVLTFDPNGSLSNESLEAVYSLDSSVLDVVLTSLERKLLFS